MNGPSTLALLLLAAALPASQAPAGHALDSYDGALAAVQAALAAHGGLEPMQAAGGATVVAEGMFDLTVRLQGRSPDEPESVPLSLWFVRWLDRSGLDVERIYNVHGQARIQDWQLDRLREMLASGDYPVAGE